MKIILKKKLTNHIILRILLNINMNKPKPNTKKQQIQNQKDDREAKEKAKKKIWESGNDTSMNRDILSASEK